MMMCVDWHRMATRATVSATLSSVSTINCFPKTAARRRSSSTRWFVSASSPGVRGATHNRSSSPPRRSEIVHARRMMRLALPQMKGRPGATVINVASISGWAPQLAMSGQYGAAKAALIFDTERWALEFVPHGVRVNTVSPGSILATDNGWDRYRLANPEYFDDYVRHGFPMGRLGTVDEVADVIAFLASPRGHWINGRNIPVDGLEQPHAPLDRRPF